jgi:hypothetical protein
MTTQAQRDGICQSNWSTLNILSAKLCAFWTLQKIRLTLLQLPPLYVSIPKRKRHSLLSQGPLLAFLTVLAALTKSVENYRQSFVANIVYFKTRWQGFLQKYVLPLLAVWGSCPLCEWRMSDGCEVKAQKSQHTYWCMRYYIKWLKKVFYIVKNLSFSLHYSIILWYQIYILTFQTAWAFNNIRQSVFIGLKSFHR